MSTHGEIAILGTGQVEKYSVVLPFGSPLEDAPEKMMVHLPLALIGKAWIELLAPDFDLTQAQLLQLLGSKPHDERSICYSVFQINEHYVIKRNCMRMYRCQLN